MTYPSFKIEKQLWEQGYEFVAGVDEAGRGPLAGPVVAAAVILPRDFKLPILKDSKLLNPSQRLYCFYYIQKHALDFSYAVVSHTVIDRINILQASLLAMKRAVGSLKLKPHYILIDGREGVKSDLPQKSIIKGDQKVVSISAASVIAKVVRDNILFGLHKKYPEYGFDRHKGYGTKKHLEMLKKHGPCLVHRKSFAPIKE
ncbi:MAG: ribonuclease HII [Candidatus Saganbacteria bacterium]|nr:ribonuclease HII [Candidatus Saganbacteria bacterium]